MIVSVFVRRLKQGRTFEDFLAEWEADRGFGVPDPRVQRAEHRRPARRDHDRLRRHLGRRARAKGWPRVAEQEGVRHDRIDTVIESTTLRQMYEVRAEHDFTAEPRAIELGSSASLLAALM